MPKLQSLNKPESLAKMARDALLDSILSGHLKLDEVYNEMALAKDLGISRTPVREALLELSVQGLVRFIPRKGVVINRFTETDVAEIFELRKALETAIVERVARNDPPVNMAVIERTLTDQRTAFEKRDYRAFLDADRAFHIEFCRLTQNRRMQAILENLRNMIHLMGTQALQLEGRGETVLAEHEAIIEAARQKDPEAARNAMLHHLDNSESAVLEGRK